MLPELGDKAIVEIRPRHIRDLVRTWRANEEMAPRTLRKVYGTLHTLFRDAVIEELIDHTPCVLSSKELGPNEDKELEWRATPVYDRDELVKLISSDALPQDRRMMYALMGLAGLRHGEMAGLRWRNYDPTREPLGKLVIARSYDHATTKSKRPREVPVHPTLATLLAEWREKGCAEILGHAPEPDDLLIPSRERDMRSRHHTRNKLLEDLERRAPEVGRDHSAAQGRKRRNARGRDPRRYFSAYFSRGLAPQIGTIIEESRCENGGGAGSRRATAAPASPPTRTKARSFASCDSARGRLDGELSPAFATGVASLRRLLECVADALAAGDVTRASDSLRRAIDAAGGLAEQRAVAPADQADHGRSSSE